MTFAKVDYRETREATKGDFGRLRVLARQLVGEPVLFGALGHPRELTIHFGPPVEFKGPRGKVLVEGSSVLGAVRSHWRIKSAPQGMHVADFVFPLNPTELIETEVVSDKAVEDFLGRIGGSTVRHVDVFLTSNGYGLQVGLSDGSVIELFPTPTLFSREYGTDEEFPVAPPDWELFTPYKRYLRVGPGSQWAYLPSDEPERKG